MKLTLPTWLLNSLSIVMRGILAVTFIMACIHKIANPFDFSLQVATYQILPLVLINLQGIILPWLELVVAVLLIVGFWTRASALVTCGMNVMFIVAISMALAAGLDLQCGCFSSADAGAEMDSGLIIRDALLLLVGGYLAIVKPDRFTLDNFIVSKRRMAS